MDKSFTTEVKGWECEASHDALRAILSDPTARTAKWDLDEFFETGRVRIDELNLQLEKHAFSDWDDVLDFGCGVGRLTRALSLRFNKAVGVDISDTMISKARELNSDRLNCEFVVNKETDLALFSDSSFNLVFSELVLQHVNSTQQIKTYISEFIRLLRPGGFLVFQLPTHIDWIHRLMIRRKLFLLFQGVGIPQTFLRSKLGLTAMLMRSIRREQMLDFIGSFPVECVESRESSSKPIRSATYFIKRNM